MLLKQEINFLKKSKLANIKSQKSIKVLDKKISVRFQPFHLTNLIKIIDLNPELKFRKRKKFELHF